MAKQVINIGTTANDGTGDPIRDAFDKVNDNFTELYTDDAGDVGSITATAPIARDSATGAVTISLLDDGVTFDKLEPRYTGTTTITATSGNTAVDWSTSTVFKLNADCTGNKSFTFSAFKVGQVITFHNLKGGYTITLIATNGTFNKLGEKDYDGSKTNALMVECIDDSANPIFNYSVLTYVSDSTPS